MEDLTGEGSSRWLYAFLLGLCAVLLNAPSMLATRVKSTEKSVVLQQYKNNGSPPAFVDFQRRFLCVFFLFAFAEGLQLVYGEALYENHFGYGRPEIGYMLLTTHASSLMLGTFVGAAADSIGRRRVSLICGLFQLTACCLASRSNYFYIVCIANVCRGIEVSVLPCVFEAWLASEHERLAFKQEWLSRTFWVMTFGMGVSAIAAGAVANLLVHRWGLGLVAPPSVAAAVSTLWVFLVWTGWTENVSSSCSSSSSPKSPKARRLLEGLLNACQAATDKRVFLLGWTQACLDLSVALFWFLWTPTLVADGRDIHSGLIYAYFMGSLMLGSVIAFLLLCGPLFVRPESFLPWIFVTASLSLLVPAYDYQEVGVLVAAFCVFHVCVGISWPSLAWLRNVYIQSDRRAGVLSLFKVPVSIGVLLILIKGGLMKQLYNSTIFYMCGFGLLSGSAAMHQLNKWRRQIPSGEEFSELHRHH